MTFRERIRAMAEALPPGGSVILPREWLLEALDLPETGPAVDYTVEQLARMLGKKPVTVRRWVGAGEFPGAYRLHGKEWRIPPAAVQAFQEKQASPGEDSLSDWRQAMQTSAKPAQRRPR